MTQQQPDLPRDDAAVDTTASLDHDALAEQLDTAHPEPGRDEVRALAITRGPGAGSRYRLEDDEVRIGRHPDAHVLLDDVTVSRRHALLTAVDGQVIITDQASLNGTYVAGERVDSHLLADGDEIQIGRFHLVYLEGPSAAPDDAHGG